MDHSERFIAENTLADLEAGQRDLRIDAANVIGATDTNMRFVRFDWHQKGADAKRRRAEFLDDGVHFFQGLLSLEIHFLETSDAFAQINHVEQGRMAVR